jgi:hypothetical protein
MTGGRFTITTLTVLAMFASGVLPGVADAGSLLSGYGGPGQGNQAILGSALVNGPSGKGGAGGGSSGGSSRGEGESGSIAQGSLAEASRTTGTAVLGVAGAGAGARHVGSGTSAAAGGSSGPAARGRHVHEAAEQASDRGSRPYKPTYGSNASHRVATGSQTLGLSGADLLYILLALGMLFLTGVLTSRLAQASHGDGVAAQAMRRRTRLSN